MGIRPHKACFTQPLTHADRTEEWEQPVSEHPLIKSFDAAKWSWTEQNVGCQPIQTINTHLHSGSLFMKKKINKWIHWISISKCTFGMFKKRKNIYNLFITYNFF